MTCKCLTVLLPLLVLSTCFHQMNGTYTRKDFRLPSEKQDKEYKQKKFNTSVFVSQSKRIRRATGKRVVRILID